MMYDRLPSSDFSESLLGERKLALKRAFFTGLIGFMLVAAIILGFTGKGHYVLHAIRNDLRQAAHHRKNNGKALEHQFVDAICHVQHDC